MKPNKKLLETELKKTRKLMEDMAIVNKNDINKIWSASFHLNRLKGNKPYFKNGYTLESAMNDDITMRNQSTNYKIKNAIYMTQEQADELNLIGNQIRDLINQYNDKFNQYTKD